MVLWWPGSRIPFVESVGFSEEHERQGRTCTQSWYRLIRRAATCGYYLLHTIFLRGKKVSLINPGHPFCIYMEKKIQISCRGCRGHSEITSSPVEAQPMLSLLGSMKTFALLSHLVSFPLKSPSLSQQH